MALPRVYDLAKELGIDTKVALSKLEELGEYVKGGSSTITPPVAAKLRAAYPNAGKAAPKKAEPKAAAPQVETSSPAAPVTKPAPREESSVADAPAPAAPKQ